MKKRKCVIENINAKKIRYAFYGRQNFGTQYRYIGTKILLDNSLMLTCYLLFGIK